MTIGTRIVFRKHDRCGDNICSNLRYDGDSERTGIVPCADITLLEPLECRLTPDRRGKSNDDGE